MIKLAFIFVLGLLISFSPDKGYNVGDRVSDFKLINVDDKYVSMADYDEAKGFILVFTCNTCPYSKLYEQRIIDLHNKYASKGYPVIAINPNDPGKSPGDSFDEMKNRATDKDYPFPYLQDRTQEVTRKYGATNTPHLYVVKKEGRDLILKYIGAIDNNARSGANASEKYVENAVEALLNNEAPETSSTKAIGCGIKWKS